MEEDKNLNQSPVQSPSPKQAPSVPEPPKPKLKPPIPIGLLFLFLLIMGTASATYLFVSQPKDTGIPKQTVQVSPSPNPNSTANWKTFTNKTLGYQISYPSEWYVWTWTDDGVVNQPSEDNYKVIYITPGNFEGSIDLNGVPKGLLITIHRNEGKLSAKEYVKKTIIPRNQKEVDEAIQQIKELNSPYHNQNLKALQERKFIVKDLTSNQSVDGVIAYNLINESAGFVANAGPETFITHGNDVIDIIGTIDETLFNQILSTLKFTN